MAGVQTQPAATTALFLFENFALGTEGASVSATSEDASGNFGADNLLDEALDTAWRSGAIAGGGVVRLRFSLGYSRTLDTVALLGSNVRVPWRIRTYRYDPAFGATPEYTSEWVDPVVKASLEDFTYETMEWNLGPPPRDLETWSEEKRLISPLFVGEPVYAVKWVDVEFDTSDPVTDGHDPDYLQVATIMISGSFQPDKNITKGWSFAPMDLSETHRTEAGALLGRRRPVLRQLSFTLGHASFTEGFRRILGDYVLKAGSLGRVLAWPQPDERQFFYQRCIVGTATSLPTVAWDSIEYSTATNFTITETR